MNNHMIMNNLSLSTDNNSYYNWKSTNSTNSYGEEIKPCCFINIDIYNCFAGCSQVVPTVPLPPIEPKPPVDPKPPLPPPIKPQPPLPPIPSIPPDEKPKGSFAHFQAKQQKLINGQSYVFSRMASEGDKIKYDIERNAILLNTDTVYRYSYMSETILGGKVPSNLENILVLNNDGISASVSKAYITESGVLTPLQSNGKIITKGDENNLRLLFNTDAKAQGLTSAIITITEIIK